jgi:twinkle protein
MFETFKQYDGFRVYKSWEDLLGFSISQSKDKHQVACPFCHSQRTKAKNQKVKEMTIRPASGRYNCHHCGENGYVTPRLFDEVKTVRPDPIKTIPTEQEKWEQWYAKRGITKGTIEAFQVSFSTAQMIDPQTREFVTKSVRNFPFIAAGQLISYKSRSMDKAMSRSKDSALIYGGLHLIPKGATKIYITEGEEDCMAVWQVLRQSGDTTSGVITVPNGASEKHNNLGYHDKSWPLVLKNLAKHKDGTVDCKFILCTDADTAGRQLNADLSRRIGEDLCEFIDFGQFKDANNALISSPKVLLDYLENRSIPIPIPEVSTLDDVMSELMDAHQSGRKAYCRLMWEEFDDLITLKPGAQSTLISAPPQTAKSEFVLNIACRLAVLYDWKFAILSPETGDPGEIYEALFEILSGKHFAKIDKFKYEQQIEEKEIEVLRTFISTHFFVIAPDNMPDYSLDSVLTILETMVKRHGITSYILDPINDIPDFFGDNLALGLIQELYRLKTFFKKYDLHQFLVAHPTNVDPDKMMKLSNIFGGSVWNAKMDNIIFLHRRKGTTVGGNIGDILEIATTKVKKRFAGKFGKMDFNYHLISRRLRVDNGVEDFDTFDTLLAKKHALLNSEFNDDDDIPF